MIKEEILEEMPEYWRECIERYNHEGKCGSVMYSTVQFIPFLCKLLAAIETEDETVRLVKTPLKNIKSLSDLLIEKAVEVERLDKEKEKAVANQDFEKAASLRDQADNLRKKKTTIPNPFHPEINLQIESATIKADNNKLKNRTWTWD